jgi:hypothetical protein
VIDLRPLGEITERTRAQEGSYASNNEWDLREPAEVNRIAVESITKMARDWGFLDVDESLPGALGLNSG